MGNAEIWVASKWQRFKHLVDEIFESGGNLEPGDNWSAANANRKHTEVKRSTAHALRAHMDDGGMLAHDWARLLGAAAVAPDGAIFTSFGCSAPLTRLVEPSCSDAFGFESNR